MPAEPDMNSWERRALEYNYPDEIEPAASQSEQSDSTTTYGYGTPYTSSYSTSYAAAWGTNPASDPVIYPGLYSASGFDMMSILLRVISRPSPKIDLGPIDASVALILCDLTKPDTPAVYVSDPFCELTGYAKPDVLGRNCRFLQAPGGQVVRKGHSRQHQSKETVKHMRRAVERNEEMQIEVVNFTKGGRRFVNLLSVIPVRWDDSKFQYSVGLLYEME